MDFNLNSPENQIGHILLEWGMITEEALRECLDLQRSMEQEQRAYIPRLGELLVERGYATADMILEALGAQNRKVLYCPKCQTNANVDVRTDVVTYRCGKCQTELVPPPNNDQIKVGDSTIMVVTRDPLPAEVQEKLQDAAAKFGKYLLMTEVGRGGVGVVYKAWDTYLGQYVALKRLKTAADNGAKSAQREVHVQSLLKEARSAVRLRHPHIATVYDIGRIQQEFYMSMEFLEGRTLAHDLQQARARGNVSPYFEAPKRYLRYMRDVARALHYAHTRPSPVIHCDMKPSNIFITVEDRAYVLDFGLARNLRTMKEEDQGVVSGTPSYMAPEQASGRNDEIDARTDVYGMGAILYELLTGRPPFLGTIQTVMKKSITEIPNRPTEVLSLRGGDTTRRLSRIPPGLEELVMRCLEKEAGARFQTANEVAAALERLLKGDASTSAGVRTAPPGSITPSPFQAPPKEPTPPAATTPPAQTPPSQAPPAAASSAPRPVEGGSRKILSFLGGVLAATLIFALVVWVSTRPKPAPPAGIEELRTLAVEFRSDLALERYPSVFAEARDPIARGNLTEFRDKLTYIEEARRRIIANIEASQQRPRLQTLRLTAQTFQRSEILKATKGGLSVFVEDERSLDVTWQQLHPEQRLELADRFIAPAGPSEMIGLGLYAALLGDLKRARAILESQKGTDLDSTARRFLLELGSR